MPDIYDSFDELDEVTQTRLGDILEIRGADSQQQAMRREFLADVPFPRDARVLECGCGTGVLTRRLAGWPGVGSVVGLDPYDALIERARKLADGLDNLSFELGDARCLPFPDASFDVVVFDSTLSHVPGVEKALTEARRVLAHDGYLAVFDGDYASTTVALSEHDPLQSCVETMMTNSVNDRFVMRHLPRLLPAAGLQVESRRSHGFIDADGSYMMTVIERGADMLRDVGHIGPETASALKAEAHGRLARGAFFGHIAYASIVARCA